MNKAVSQTERALWLYTFLMVLLTITSWLVYAHYATSDRRPLFMRVDQYRDLTNYAEKTQHLYHRSKVLGGRGAMFNYPPVAAFVYHVLLFTFPTHPVKLYLVFLTLCDLGLALAAWRASVGPMIAWIAAAGAILTTAALAHPLWFVADRGNVEGVAWAFAAVGLCFLLRGRCGIGAVLIGLAASVKPFPILFLLLLVRRGRYREALLGVVTTGVVTLAALIALGPNPVKAYQDLKPGLERYTATYITNLGYVDQIRFQHSLLDGMKSAALIIEAKSIDPERINQEVDRVRFEPGGWHVAHSLVRVYPFIAVASLLALLAVFYRLPMLNQLTALAVAINLFPVAAPDYTLLHLLVPFGALVVFLVREVATGKADFSNGAMLTLAVIYALLFAPLTPLRVFAGDAKLILLLILVVAAALCPMRSIYFDKTAVPG